MKNIYTDFSGFFKALKRNSIKHPLFVNKSYDLIQNVNYWFCTQKAVWSYTVQEDVEISIIENRLEKMDNIIFSK